VTKGGDKAGRQEMIQRFVTGGVHVIDGDVAI